MKRNETRTSTTPEERLAGWLQGQTLQDWRDRFDRDGYVLFERVLPAQTLAAIRDAVDPYLRRDLKGRNNFEGVRSKRVYALLAKSPVFADLAIHPLPLAFAEAEFGSSCLLSACLAIELEPGESAQPWHHDDAHIDLPRPRPSCGVSAFWTIDDTTGLNGATEILPGSHTWPETDISGANSAKDFLPSSGGVSPSAASGADPGARPDAIKITMPAGSLMIAKGTLWHRGGANRSDKPRLIVTPQYCPGWARQLENMCLAVPPHVAGTLPERARELLGYSIHAPFMGYVDGVHPRRVLATDD